MAASVRYRTDVTFIVLCLTLATALLGASGPTPSLNDQVVLGCRDELLGVEVGVPRAAIT